MKIFQREMRYWLLLAFLAVAYFCTIVRSQGNWKTREPVSWVLHPPNLFVGSPVFPGRKSISFYLFLPTIYNVAMEHTTYRVTMSPETGHSDYGEVGLREDAEKLSELNLWKSNLQVARSSRLINSNRLYVCVYLIPRLFLIESIIYFKFWRPRLLCSLGLPGTLYVYHAGL